MLVYLFSIVLCSNLIIGILLGLTGISGFLLPLIYVGFLHLPLRESLALSFLSFAVSGMIGAYSYWKSKSMDTRLALFLNIGSLPGAFLGVQLNVWIPDNIVKLLLYAFILLAGLSILFKKNQDNHESNISVSRSNLLENKIMVVLIGVITAAICSLTGAGGPILLVPLLASLGVNIRVAVGVSLLNSVIIAIPSIFGYFAYSNMESITQLIIASLIGTTLGIVAGAYYANRVKINYLRIFIALVTILSSIYMLITMFI